MFFFIGSEEAFSLREDVPFKLKLAAKFPGLKVIEFIAKPLTYVALIIACIIFFMLVMTGLRGSVTQNAAYDVLGICLIFLVIAIACATVGGITEWLGGIRKDILKGKYRQYYVVASDTSFDVLASPAVRIYLQEKSWLPIRVLASDPRVSGADLALHRLSKGKSSDTVARARQQLVLLSVLEAPLAGLGIKADEYFTSRRSTILDSLKDWEAKLETELEACEELMSHHFG